MRVLLLLALVGCVGTVTGTTTDTPPPAADPQTGCATGCHGNDNNNAPPMSISGVTDTTYIGVGAHQSHLNASPTWHAQVACADCHPVPAQVSSPGHMDGKVDVVFSAKAGGSMSMWNGTTCSAHCHGDPTWGGNHTTPTWTQVDGTQATCGACHGAPPPPPHVQGITNCAQCHPTMEENSLTFRDPGSHINGTIDVVDPTATGGCTTCHGSTNAAPPKDLAGNTSNTSPGVGAHQAHLIANSPWHRDVVCSDCHTVPQMVSSPGHMNGVVDVIFTTLNPAGAFDKATSTCTTLYCHGNGRGNNGTKSWITPGALPCTGCHATNGTNMSGEHSRHINGEGMKCSGCHATVVNAAMTIIAPMLHVNGVHEVKMANGTYNATTKTCANTGCHGTKTW